MDLSILIVTYNSAKLMARLLDHLARELNSLSAEVIVVDNASRDETANLVREQYPWVKLIASQENLGFAAGNNLGAKQATGRYLLLLNPDAMPEPGALKRGIELMDQHPEAGLAGGELRGADGSRQPSARMFPSLRDELFVISGLAAKFPQSPLFGRLDRRWADPEIPAQVDWIPGAFVFIPKRLWTDLGGFDERFFMYYEEVDLCRRIQQAGASIRYWPELKAMHIGGESAKTVEKQRVSRAGSQLESWRMRSALLYYRKHHGLLGAIGLYWIEWSWHKLRQVKSQLQHRHEQATDFAMHCTQLKEAWHDTARGITSPKRPW
jgi:N-acetylglucosaminyl-diphospho-decaprenol L-rhamnosyltransferase